MALDGGVPNVALDGGVANVALERGVANVALDGGVVKTLGGGVTKWKCGKCSTRWGKLASTYLRIQLFTGTKFSDFFYMLI